MVGVFISDRLSPSAYLSGTVYIIPSAASLNGPFDAYFQILKINRNDNGQFDLYSPDLIYIM